MVENNSFNRRKFLTSGIMATSALALAQMQFSQSSNHTNAAQNNGTSNATLPTRKLGTLEVTGIGLGCMSMTSLAYNPQRPITDMVKVIRGAYDNGVTFFDTAEVYGAFTNEEYVG